MLGSNATSTPTVYTGFTGLKKCDAAKGVTAVYIDELTRKEVAIKCVIGMAYVSSGSLSSSNRCWFVADIKWRGAPPGTPQSNGILERAMKLSIQGARSHVVRFRRGRI